MDKKNTFELKIIGTQKCFGDLSILSTYRFNNGKSFPLSYTRFVTKYGYGLTVDLFHIYIPLADHGDSIFIRSDEIRSTYYEDIVNGDIWFEVATDVSLTTLKNLYPFASSDNGEYLFWDINSSTNEGDEMDIYITDFRGIELKKVASNLYEFIDKITDVNRYQELIPFSNHPLPSIFKVLNLID
ncbi:SMI1/KNR4 family protein [Prevotella intermedia]|uniref:SMI1/KNR4 family protein n=1 Tax=Prevotella intermedia TaxID=28131 RepID=A0A2G9ICN6_PREIN|nr:SMI1/KNR4 family protein [Prevotella intermedia]PIN27526.1 hypothetical protein CUC04_09145 [Prevotella intermedia]